VGQSWGVVPASANPLAVSRSAPATVLYRSRHRQVCSFGPGITLATLGLQLASAVPRGRLRWARPRLAGCGIIGLRCVVQAGSIGLSASFPATAA